MALLRFSAFVGAAVSLYALWTEHKISAAAAAGDEFSPICDIRGFASCSKVLTSDYSYPLSLCGLVPRGHTMDVSNAFAGLLWYLLAAIHAYLPLLRQPSIFLALSVGSLGYSCFLFYVLKFILRDLCLVCVLMYIANIGIFIAAARPVAARLTRQGASPDKQKVP
jgi:vitamin-K-epoxide reductase (warfarin-sensitive)